MANLIQLDLEDDDISTEVNSSLIIVNEDRTIYLKFGLDQFYKIIDYFLNIIGEQTTEELKDKILSQQNKIEELQDILEQYKELYD